MTRILVVHDDPQRAQELVRLLLLRGYEVDHAQLGAAAMRLFSERPHDIVVAEVMLPDTTGTVLAGNLRKVQGGADVPIVLISEVYGSGDLLDDELDRLGVLHFLPQPYSLSDLLTRIGRIAAGPGLARELVRERRASAQRRAASMPAPAPDFPSMDLPLEIDEPSPEAAPPPSAPSWLAEAEQEAPQYGGTHEVMLELGRVASSPGSPAPPSPELAEASAVVSIDIGRPTSGVVVKPAYFRNLPVRRLDQAVWVSSIADLFHHRDAGELRLHGEDAERTFYFLNGYPVWVEVDPPDLGCAAYLAAEGWITENDAGRLAATQKRLGWGVTRTLATLQILAPEEVDALLQGWVEREVADGLSRTGTVEFRGGDDFNDRIPVYETNPISALWGLVQTSLRLGTAELGLSRAEGRYLRRRHTHDRLFGYVATTSALTELRDWLAESRSFESLRDYFQEDWEEIARCLWFGVHSGVIEVTEEPVDEITSFADFPAVDDALDGDGEDLSEITRRFSKSEVARKLARREAREEASPEEEDAELVIIRDYVEKMELDHYHFMGLERDCSTEELQAAYDTLAARYRTNMLPANVSPDVRRKGKELLARLVRAWRVLSDPGRRRGYQSGLGDDDDQDTGSWDTAEVHVVDDFEDEDEDEDD